MRFLVLLVAISALVVSNDASAIKAATSRANLNVGHVVYGDKLLLRTYVYQPAIPNTIQYQDVVFRGNVTTRITAVQATEVGYTQYGYPSIVSGGVGMRNVTVRVTSSRGYGYYYLVDVWGR